MKTHITEIINQYNTSVLKAKGIDTEQKYKCSVVYSEAEKEKMLPVLMNYGMSLSEFVRYAIHHLADSIK